VVVIAYRAYNLEGKIVGTVGAGHIKRILLQRLKPFNCTLLYHDRLKMEPELEIQTWENFEEDLDLMLSKYDIVVINMPLTEKIRYDFQLILNIEVWIFCL
jgi:formate dehydrogenase